MTVDQLETLRVPGGDLYYWIRGQGPALVVLHNELGFAPSAELLARLARTFTVVAPALPGFPPSTTPTWMRTATEMACVMNRVIRTLGYAPYGVLGLGFGGWIAAEMAVQCPELIKWMVLQAPVGIKPAAPEEIVDRFLFKEEEYVRMGFADARSFSRNFGEVADEEQIRQWDSAREMMTRVAYKPYMFNASLRHLIVDLETPAMVVWGEGDQLVPRSCAQSYASAMPRGDLVTTPGGHWLDLEHADELSELVAEFAEKMSEQTRQGKKEL